MNWRDSELLINRPIGRLILAAFVKHMVACLKGFSPQFIFLGLHNKTGLF